MILTAQELEVVILSLKIGSFAVICSLPIALFFAWFLAKFHFFGKSILDSLLHLPLILPPVALGYLLLITMGKKGFIGQWLYEQFDLVFIFNWKGAALASAIVSFPLLMRSIRLSIELIDKRIEFVAQTLGASKWRVFFSITLPLCLPGIISGMILAFARCLGEFGATITFASNIVGETRTIPLEMYSLMQNPATQENQVMRLCMLSIGISLIALIVAEWLNRRYKKRTLG